MKTPFLSSLFSLLLASAPLGACLAQTPSQPATGWPAASKPPAPKAAATKPKHPATKATGPKLTAARPVLAKPATTRPVPAPPAAAPAVAPPPAPSRKRAVSVMAGPEPFSLGANVISFGVGLGNHYGYVGSGLTVAPAFSIAYERSMLALGPGILGVGGFVGYQRATSKDVVANYRFSDLIVAARGVFHYPVSPQLEVYGGVALGVRRAGVSFDGSPGAGDYAASATDGYSALFVGGRYYFGNSLGAFAELGYDQSWLKVGVSARF